MTVTGARTYLKTHKISGKQLRFHLSEEQDALLERAGAGRTGRTAKTLVKEGPFEDDVGRAAKGSEHDKAPRGWPGVDICTPR